MATSNVDGDKYRSYLTPEELKTTQWKAGPPNYDVVNKLFEEGRTKVWPAGSLEEYVQILSRHGKWSWSIRPIETIIKLLIQKVRPRHQWQEVFYIGGSWKGRGSYNVFLQTSLPPALRFYDPDKETYDSSQTAFKQVFPRGFALEVLQLYSGPPVIAFKYRHWGYMEGSFKEHAPTGELIEMFGIAIFELNEENKVVKVEFFHDRGELLANLIKGRASDESIAVAPPSGCPFMA